MATTGTIPRTAARLTLMCSMPCRNAGQGIFKWNSLISYPRFLLGYGLTLPYVMRFLGLLSWKPINTWPKGRWTKEDIQVALGNPYTILGVWLVTASTGSGFCGRVPSPTRSGIVQSDGRPVSPRTISRRSMLRATNHSGTTATPHRRPWDQGRYRNRECRTLTWDHQ
jgi:hypothetical protein